jgi:hypothetical protein
MVLAAWLGGCATNPAPRAYRVSSDDYPRNPMGSWVQVSGDQFSRSGELIAVGDNGLFLTLGDRQARRIEHLTFVRFADAREIRVYAHDTGNGIAALTMLGVLSTLSHGFVLILSAPTWVLSGSVANAAAGYAGHYTYKNAEVARLMRFARFPQGLPPSWLPTPTPTPTPTPEPTPTLAPEPLPGADPRTPYPPPDDGGEPPPVE